MKKSFGGFFMAFWNACSALCVSFAWPKPLPLWVDFVVGTSLLEALQAVGSTCLSWISILRWDSPRDNVKFGHLVYDERAACPQWSFEREMSLSAFWASIWTGGISPSSSSRHLCLPRWLKKQLSCLGRRVPSLGSGRALCLVCREKCAFVSQWWPPSSFHCLLSIWSVFTRTPVCLGACPNSGSHLHSENQPLKDIPVMNWQWWNWICFVNDSVICKLERLTVCCLLPSRFFSEKT